MTNKRTRMSREDRQAQILAAALDVFADKGYNGATTLEIAKAANISEVTLFRHFSSKKEIFNSSIQPIIFTTLKESITASKNLTKEEQLKYILKERIKLVSKNRKVMRLVVMENQINTELSEFNYIDKIAQILKDTISDIGIILENDDFTIRLLMGAILSFLYLAEDDEREIDSFVDSMMDLIIKS